MKKLLLLFTSAVLFASLSACGAERAESTELFAMNTVMNLTAYGENAPAALLAAQREISRLEALLSRTLPESEISRINHALGQGTAVSPEVSALLRVAQRYSVQTDGAFDPTIAPLVAAWGFTEQTQRVPTATQLQALLPSVGVEKLTLAADTATLAAGSALDLGGIAKGYASDQVAALFREFKISSGVISLGGNVYVQGSRPDGAPWQVAIQDPAGSRGDEGELDPSRNDAYVGTLGLRDAFAITSGGYQRHFEQNGESYHHILDPTTGYPAESGLVSVTVVGESGTFCDAYSTALFVLGEDAALELWRESERAFGLVLVTEDNRVVVTENLREQFQEEEDSGYDYAFVS